MSEGSPANENPGQELVQATIAIADLASAKTQAGVQSLLDGIEGVKSVAIVEGSLHVCYDPLFVTEKELEARLSEGGIKPLGGEAERDSPFAPE